MKKSELSERIEELEGRLVSLEDVIDGLKRDIHQAHNPYRKVGSPEWQKYAKELVKTINIYT